LKAAILLVLELCGVAFALVGLFELVVQVSEALEDKVYLCFFH
jgi:hypothetical protein